MYGFFFHMTFWLKYKMMGFEYKVSSFFIILNIMSFIILNICLKFER